MWQNWLRVSTVWVTNAYVHSQKAFKNLQVMRAPKSRNQPLLCCIKVSGVTAGFTTSVDHCIITHPGLAQVFDGKFERILRPCKFLHPIPNHSKRPPSFFLRSQETENWNATVSLSGFGCELLTPHCASQGSQAKLSSSRPETLSRLALHQDTLPIISSEPVRNGNFILRHSKVRWHTTGYNRTLRTQGYTGPELQRFDTRSARPYFKNRASGQLYDPCRTLLPMHLHSSCSGQRTWRKMQSQVTTQSESSYKLNLSLVDMHSGASNGVRPLQNHVRYIQATREAWQLEDSTWVSLKFSLHWRFFPSPPVSDLQAQHAKLRSMGVSSPSHHSLGTCIEHTST